MSTQIFGENDRIPTDSKGLVGSPATYQVGSDSYPCTVLKASPKGNKIVVRREKPAPRSVESTGSHSVSTQFVAGSEEIIAHRTEDGRYRAKDSGQMITIGRRVYALDRSF